MGIDSRETSDSSRLFLPQWSRPPRPAIVAGVFKTASNTKDQTLPVFRTIRMIIFLIAGQLDFSRINLYVAAQIAVRTSVTGRPPHRSRRALFAHQAPTFGA